MWAERTPARQLARAPDRRPAPAPDSREAAKRSRFDTFKGLESLACCEIRSDEMVGRTVSVLRCWNHSHAGKVDVTEVLEGAGARAEGAQARRRMAATSVSTAPGHAIAHSVLTGRRSVTYSDSGRRIPLRSARCRSVAARPCVNRLTAVPAAGGIGLTARRLTGQKARHRGRVAPHRRGLPSPSGACK